MTQSKIIVVNERDFGSYPVEIPLDEIDKSIYRISLPFADDLQILPVDEKGNPFPISFIEVMDMRTVFYISPSHVSPQCKLKIAKKKKSPWDGTGQPQEPLDDEDGDNKRVGKNSTDWLFRGREKETGPEIEKLAELIMDSRREIIIRKAVKSET